MDGDPAVEPELDTFSLVLPLPYRIGVIFVLGIWAWGFNLQYLSFLKIVSSSPAAIAPAPIANRTILFCTGRPFPHQIHE